VNDVAHSLEKVIPKRSAEGTWQVDSYSGDSVVSNRPPDEVCIIVYLLYSYLNFHVGNSPVS
jgi:hypothetical protein